MKGKAIPYSPEERLWLENNRLLPIAEYHEAFCRTFFREDVTASNLHSLRVRKGWKTGRTGHFSKGQEPVNKGVPCPPGVGGRHPNAQRTQFKKGSLSGRAAKIRKPIGAERLSKDGYLERKINDDMPFQARWRAVHLIRWEALHGPVPAGHCLKCKDGDKTNTDPANWMVLERAIMPTLNGGRHKRQPGFDEAPAELRPALITLARVKVRRQKIRKEGSAA